MPAAGNHDDPVETADRTRPGCYCHRDGDRHAELANPDRKANRESLPPRNRSIRPNSQPASPPPARSAATKGSMVRMAGDVSTPRALVVPARTTKTRHTALRSSEMWRQRAITG